MEAEEAKLDAELKKKKSELYAENESAELLWRVFRDNHRFFFLLNKIFLTF